MHSTSVITQCALRKLTSAHKNGNRYYRDIVKK